MRKMSVAGNGNTAQKSASCLRGGINQLRIGDNGIRTFNSDRIAIVSKNTTINNRRCSVSNFYGYKTVFNKLVIFDLWRGGRGGLGKME